MIKLNKRYTIFIVAIFLVRSYLMSNKHNYKNKTTWLLHASLGVILIGIVTSLIQMQQTINIRTKADTLSPSISTTPTTAPGFTPNPLDMQLFVSAKIIGIGEDGNRNPKHLTRSATVGVYDMKNQLVKEGYGFIIYDRINLFRGIIHFGPVENGTYFIKILTPHMLRAVVTPTFQALDSKRLNILPQVTLLQGDINDDNVVDITDYNLALGCFQDKNCQDKNLIDFSDDGLANIIDYNILLHDYWESQGD